LKYFFSIILLCGTSIYSFSQETEAEEKPTSAEVKKVDTVKINYTPTGIRVGTDLISLVRNQVDTKYTGWEVNADIDFYRYYLAVDYGYWAKHLPLKNGDFSNSGNYFRIGADVNFLLKDPDRNMFFLGYRYGQSVFDHRSNYLNYLVIDPKSQTNYSDSGVSAHWMELTSGLRVKIWKMIWMGYTARFKFAPRASGYSELQPYDIPGYGIFEKKIYWGFNSQLFIKIPVRKQERPKSILTK
jgi:hypothetical protein